MKKWEELVEAYLGRFFPPSLTSERRKEISVFNQGEDESLYTAWERFKRLLKRCPMHDIDLKTQMDIFYHSMNDTSKGISFLLWGIQKIKCRGGKGLDRGPGQVQYEESI